MGREAGGGMALPDTKRLKLSKRELFKHKVVLVKPPAAGFQDLKPFQEFGRGTLYGQESKYSNFTANLEALGLQ